VLVGVYFLVLVVVAFRKAFRLTVDYPNVLPFRLLFANLLFLFLNNQVSGELNDNKWLWATIGLIIAFQGYPSLNRPATSKSKANPSQVCPPSLVKMELRYKG
jgi:hypothetical protein